MPKIPNIKWSKFDDLFDFEKFSDDFQTVIDFGEKIFSPKDIHDITLKGIDKLKENISANEEIANANLFIPEHSEHAKEVFAPFLNEDSSTETLNAISDGSMNNVISFEGINHDTLPIGVSDLGLDASDLVGLEDVADGIDLVDNAADGIDLLSSFEPITFLLGAAASVGVGYIFKKRHKKKSDRIQELAKNISPKMSFLNALQKDVPVEQSFKLYKSLKSDNEI
nr:hypothetical protein [uncultured Draconibacterium sp.]